MADARQATRVAVLSDVHGNAVALEAVLRDVASAQPDLLVFGGDLTWGPLPEETRALVEPLRPSAVFVRGNAERALTDAARQMDERSLEELSARERWMVERHSPETHAFLSGFVESAVVEIAGLGAVRFCHGSPRSDEELITYATPEPRMRALLAGVPEKVLVSAHTHIRFDRMVAGVRSLNPGSVGMPYEERAGAYWALLGPDVDLRRTEYDVDEAVRRYRATGDPLAEQMVEILVSPPTPNEVVEHAEALEFSG
jgi:predicted phosphodiesterase